MFHLFFWIRFTFANAPVNTRDSSIAMMIYQYAAQYAMKRPVAINVQLTSTRPTNVLELNNVCMKHNILDLYIWLSLRFPDWFVEHDKCLEMKKQCLEMVEGALELENLGHKFCHVSEYRTIRQKNQLRRDDFPLPPPHFGTVRKIAADIMKNYRHDELFCFPHLKRSSAAEGEGWRNVGEKAPFRRNGDFNRKKAVQQEISISNDGEFSSFHANLLSRNISRSKANRDTAWKRKDTKTPTASNATVKKHDGSYNMNVKIGSKGVGKIDKSKARVMVQKKDEEEHIMQKTISATNDSAL